MDTGFVLALPFHHGDLELDSVGLAPFDEISCCYFGSMAMVVGGGGGGRPAICEITIPVQDLRLKMYGGLYANEGGRIFRTLWYMS